jgi:valyl-tRNA synthetase
MSKSKGNSPDPLDLIAKYGADGLRFGLMRIAPSGQDFAFDEKQIEEGRNFATKLWNAARFRQMHGPSEAAPNLETFSLSLYSVEVLSRLDQTIDGVEAAYNAYQFNLVAQQLYDFFWNDYCDWFVEAAKMDIFGADEAKKASALAVMDYVLSATLRLLHPFMPHITEELWSIFGFGESSIQFEPSPKPLRRPHPSRRTMAAVIQLVRAGRNLRAQACLSSSEKAKFALRSNDGEIVMQQPIIAHLLNASELLIDVTFEPTAGMPVATTRAGELVLVLEVDREAEAQRLDKEIAKLEVELSKVNQKLANASFVDRAPAAVVQEHRQRKTDFTDQLAQLRQARAAMD